MEVRATCEDPLSLQKLRAELSTVSGPRPIFCQVTCWRVELDLENRDEEMKDLQNAHTERILALANECKSVNFSFYSVHCDAPITTWQRKHTHEQVWSLHDVDSSSKSSEGRPGPGRFKPGNQGDRCQGPLLDELSQTPQLLLGAALP